LTAKESVTINGGGSYTVWNAGAIKSGTTGSHVAHAVTHGGPAAKSVAVVMPSLPFVPENLPKLYSIQANAKALMGVGADKKLATQPTYRAYNTKGELLARGAVKSDGTMGPVFTDKPEKVRFVIGDGDWLAPLDPNYV
jgi:type VI secretion system secreted protein VgrG